MIPDIVGFGAFLALLVSSYAVGYAWERVK